MSGATLSAYNRQGQFKAAFSVGPGNVSIRQFYQHTEISGKLISVDLRSNPSSEAPERLLTSDADSFPTRTVAVDSSRSSDSEDSEDSEDREDSPVEDRDIRVLGPLPVSELYKYPRYMTRHRTRAFEKFDFKTAPFVEFWVAITDANPDSPDAFHQQHLVVVRMNSLVFKMTDDSIFELVDQLIVADYYEEAMKKSESDTNLVAVDGDTSTVAVAPSTSVMPSMRVGFHCWAVQFDISREKMHRVIFETRHIDAVTKLGGAQVEGQLCFDEVEARDPEASKPFQTYLSIVRSSKATNLVQFLNRSDEPEYPLSLSVLLQNTRFIFTLRFLDWILQLKEEMMEMGSAFKERGRLKKQAYVEYLKDRLNGGARAIFVADGDAIGVPLKIALINVQAMFPGILPYQTEIMSLRDLKDVLSRGDVTRENLDAKLRPSAKIGQLTNADCLVARAPLIVCQNAPAAFDVGSLQGRVASLFEAPVENDPMNGNALLILAHQLDLSHVKAGQDIDSGRSFRRQEQVMAPTDVAIHVGLRSDSFEKRNIMIDLLIDNPKLHFSEPVYVAVSNLLEEFNYAALVRKRPGRICCSLIRGYRLS